MALLAASSANSQFIEFKKYTYQDIPNLLLTKSEVSAAIANLNDVIDISHLDRIDAAMPEISETCWVDGY